MSVKRNVTAPLGRSAIAGGSVPPRPAVRELDQGAQPSPDGKHVR
jgi:hypothetical protein